MEAEQCTDASNLQGNQAPVQALFPYPLPGPITRKIPGERPQMICAPLLQYVYLACMSVNAGVLYVA